MFRREGIMDVMTEIENKEGPIGRTIEQYASKVPSDFFLWAAAGSIALSLGLKLAKREHGSLFVGQWAPTFLLLGVFNKLVKSLSAV